MKKPKIGLWFSIKIILRECQGFVLGVVQSRSLKQLNYNISRVFFGRWRDGIATALSHTLPAVNTNNSEHTAAHTAALAQLHDRGFALLPDLCSPERAHALFQALQSVPCHDPYRPELGSLRADNLPAETHVAHLDRGPLIRCKLAMDLANDPRIVALVGDWMHAKPTALVSAWWSSAADGEAEAAEFFHRDKDDWRFIKLFVYLTEVTAETGPHVYVPTSHRHSGMAFRQQRRYSDAEVEAVFDTNSWQVFCGGPGTAIMENTFGLHKGLPVRAGRRLMFQVTYSLFPLLYAPDSPEVAASELEGSYDAHINRVHVEPAT